MRLITVNVCGIRSASAMGLFRWLARQNADFICLQETKCHVHQLAEHDVELRGYQSFFCDAERKGYAGVALYTRHQPDKVIRGFGVPEFDREGRYLEARFADLSIVSLYLPSGSAGPPADGPRQRLDQVRKCDDAHTFEAVRLLELLDCSERALAALLTIERERHRDR